MTGKENAVARQIERGKDGIWEDERKTLHRAATSVHFEAAGLSVLSCVGVPTTHAIVLD